MEDNWYAVQQEIHDRIACAQAYARAQALARRPATPHRSRYAVGVALIRLGGWILASGTSLPAEIARPLVALRSATTHPMRPRPQ
jgi:hypothetical protein